MPVTVHSVTASPGGAAASINPTFPAGYTADSRLIFILSGNQALTGITFSAGATGSVLLANAGGRMWAYEVIPNGLGQAGFTASFNPPAPVSSNHWFVGRIEGAKLGAIVGTANNLGSNSTAPIAIPTLTGLPRTTDGTELKLWAAGVNATATWTAQGASVYTSGTTQNGALQVLAAALASGLTTVSNTDLNRGLAGTARNESAISLAIFPPLTAPGITFDHAGIPLSVYGAGAIPLVAGVV